jgi:lysozyme
MSILSERFNRLRNLLIKHEGVRLKPYQCSAGKTSIGVGRNLDDVGITYDEVMILLRHDMERVEKECLTRFAWFQSLSPVRQTVILSMVFNLGVSRFQGFKKLIAALESQNYDRAADEMMASKWAGQVGLRAIELATMMRTGKYLPGDE